MYSIACTDFVIINWPDSPTSSIRQIPDIENLHPRLLDVLLVIFKLFAKCGMPAAHQGRLRLVFCDIIPSSSQPPVVTSAHWNGSREIGPGIEQIYNRLIFYDPFYS